MYLAVSIAPNPLLGSNLLFNLWARVAWYLLVSPNSEGMSNVKPQYLQTWPCLKSKSIYMNKIGTFNCFEVVDHRYSALQKNSFFGYLWSKKGSIQIEIKYLRSAVDLDLLAPSKGVIGLSIEVVYDLVEQGAAKLQSLKVCSVRDSNPGRPKSSDLLQ